MLAEIKDLMVMEQLVKTLPGEIGIIEVERQLGKQQGWLMITTWQGEDVRRKRRKLEWP